MKAFRGKAKSRAKDRAFQEEIKALLGLPFNNMNPLVMAGITCNPRLIYEGGH